MARVITGPRFVLQALRGHSDLVAIYLDAKKPDEQVRSEATERGVPVHEKSRPELDKLAKGTKHQGCVAQAGPYRYLSIDALESGDPKLVVALDEVTDPHNLGAIVRSAVTLGADAIVLPKHRSASVTPAVVRASAGATEHAAIIQVTNLQRTLATLSEQRWLIAGLDADGDATVEALATARTPLVLVVGSEGRGLRRMVRQRCDMLVSIAQSGPVGSLNASVAAAIAIYEARRANHE